MKRVKAVQFEPSIKKESPNEGTETKQIAIIVCFNVFPIKKESPNEGTETPALYIGNINF